MCQSSVGQNCRPFRAVDRNLLQNQTEGPIRASTNIIELDHPRHQTLLRADQSFALVIEEKIIKVDSPAFHLFHRISHLCFHIVVSESSEVPGLAGGAMQQAKWLQWLPFHRCVTAACPKLPAVLLVYIKPVLSFH